MYVSQDICYECTFQIHNSAICAAVSAPLFKFSAKASLFSGQLTLTFSEMYAFSASVFDANVKKQIQRQTRSEFHEDLPILWGRMHSRVYAG